MDERCTNFFLLPKLSDHPDAFRVEELIRLPARSVLLVRFDPFALGEGGGGGVLVSACVSQLMTIGCFRANFEA